MSLETDVQVLTQATTDLLSAVNVKKATLDQSVNDAAAQVSLATTQATNAAASAATATTKAGEAAGSAAQALAIYGNTAAQQAAVTAAQNAASVAAGHAASASSVVQQDLSGVNAAALHRSPNAVTAMFVYDTSKDSDGGAWTEKCQHTSWYNEAINGKWLGAQASEAAARAVSGATTGDYFQLTTDGKFYKLNATSGTTEVFRGNKREFPKLSAIVAEGSSQGNERQNIVIYDLTEPNRPMWMVFYGDVYNTKFISGGIVTCISAINGVLASGNNYGSPYYGGFRVANFAGDWMHRWSGLYGNNGRSIVGIGYRNSNSVGFPFGGGDRGTTVPYPGGDVASGQINAVAMTVLPDAPIDPVTGLQVPTIAVGTGNGVSVIKHNGTVVTNSGGGNYTSVAIVGATLLGRINQSAGTWFYAPLSVGALAAGFTLQGMGGQFSAEWGTIKPSGQNVQAFVGGSNRINTMRFNRADANKPVVASITNTFNTGHQVGDIRRTYLSDIEAGSVSGTELVTNGTFDTDISGWTPSVASKATWDASGALKLSTTDATDVMAHQTLTGLVVGQTYLLNFRLTSVSGLLSCIVAIGTSPGNGSALFFPTGTAGTHTTTFTATATSLVLLFSNYADSVSSFLVDDVSVRASVADRSYKAKTATITGTLTKTAVASAAQLVAYSGFSASNYLREPYSADLDFGTGEWTASAWVNVPVSLPTSGFGYGPELLVSSDLNGWGTVGSATINSSTQFALNANGLGNRVVSPSFGIGNGAYRATFRMKANKSATVFATNLWGSDTNLSLTTEYVEYTVYFYGTGSTQNQYLGFYTSASSPVIVDIDTISVKRVLAAPIAHRAHLSGASIWLGVEGNGYLTATAFDGTTTRTVTTTAAYNTATWLKVRANYTTDGSLALLVNGQEVAVTRGAPPLTLNNSNAVLTIGNSYAADAPFPGSIALVKFSATVPTPEQSVWMYEQEKQMFREGAQVCLPDSGSIVDLTYDDATDKWIAVSATNESEWSGLVRTSVTAVPAGSYTKASAASGVQLLARSTTSPGVDITIPAYGLREELVKRAESAARLARSLTTFDYVGGFTASTTNGSTSITSVAGLTYPTSYIGARVTGSGIPADTVITAVSGTTIYLSKAATATASNVQISFTDFILPVGYEAKDVLMAGVSQKEGATAAFTRQFDGFKETIRFGTAPAYNANVTIQATRSVQ